MPVPISVAANRAAAFAPLVGCAPLTRVVHTAIGAVADPGRVVVAAAESLIADVRDSLSPSDLGPLVVVVADDGTRAGCLAAGLQYLEREAISSSHVLVHEISRPLGPTDVAHRVIAALRDGAAVVIPAVAVTDSVKAVDARGAVTATLDRSTLRATQYPRGFAVDQLSRLLAARASDEFDELEEALRAGVPILVVDGDPDGFRIDLPRDTQFVEALIASRGPHGV